MPRNSERQTLLSDVVDVMAIAILDEEDDEDLELSDLCDNELFSPVGELSELLLHVQSARYLADRQRLPKSIAFNENVFCSLAEPEFRQIARMTKGSFWRVVSEIQDHPVFINQSPFPQAPVWQQLAVSLDRFANYGTGASLSRTQHLWGTGRGPWTTTPTALCSR